MSGQNFRFMLKRIDYDDRVGMWVGSQAIDEGGFWEMDAPTFTQHKEHEAASLVPALELTTDSCIRLMDELWAIGIRPTEQGTGGQLEAVKYHLEDLRKLVFAKNSIESSKSTQTLNDVWDRIERTRAAKAGEEK